MTARATPGSPAAVTSREEDGRLVLELSGDLTLENTKALWKDAIGQAASARGRDVVVEGSGIDDFDGFGALLVLRMDMARQAGSLGQGSFTISGFSPAHKRLLDLYRPCDYDPSQVAPRSRETFAHRVGRATVSLGRDLKELIGFVGEMTMAFLLVARNPRAIRFDDFLLLCVRAGVGALPIVGLIGFLMGLVLAFQAAVPMGRFGADIYVSDMLGLSITRELGALVTAILLAGRSGSAFAAEIGTMKVNEEVDALTTMGLNPLRFLAAPRVLAAMCVMPILTIFFELFALAGGALVVQNLGYSYLTYLNRIAYAVKIADILGGLFKAEVFAILVAAIGCRRGLTTGRGADAVGLATTSAVVSGLILIALADGLLAFIFYVLKI